MDATKPTETASSPTQALIKRLRRNMTQSEISRRTGIPQPRLSRWEDGEVAAGADDVFKLQALEAEVGDSAASGATATAN